MNVLLNKFPTKIRIDDEIYSVKSDFRNCLKIIMAYEDDTLTLEEKYCILLKRLYNTVPKKIEEAIRKGVLFLNCGKEDSSNINDNVKRVYSFNKDGEYIYSAINQTHNTDLESIEYLHWWKFVFFFMDVDKDCTLSYLTSLRDKKNKGKLDKEEKNIWYTMRKILDLDYIPDEEQEESDFMKKWNGR